MKAAGGGLISSERDGRNARSYLRLQREWEACECSCVHVSVHLCERNRQGYIVFVQSIDSNDMKYPRILNQDLIKVKGQIGSNDINLLLCHC